jgi:hypothetical protein
LRPFNKE